MFLKAHYWLMCTLLLRGVAKADNNGHITEDITLDTSAIEDFPREFLASSYQNKATEAISLLTMRGL
jgi:hypothetical protein